MSNNLSEILDFDDVFHEKFEEIGNKFVPVLAQSNYVATSTTLIGLMASANSVKLGIYDLAEVSETNLYVIKILQRTLIEHYLKYYYVLFRFIQEGTDDVGTEYRKYSAISETLAYINASSVAKSIIGNSTENQILKILKKKHPEFNISKKELGKITFKWKHRSIVKYIKSNTEIIKTEKSYLLKLIPEYAELSSFIHGGTFAEEYYQTLFREGKLSEVIYNTIFEVVFMAASMRLHLMLAVTKIDASFSPNISQLSILIRDFLNKNT